MLVHSPIAEKTMKYNVTKSAGETIKYASLTEIKDLSEEKSQAVFLELVDH